MAYATYSTSSNVCMFLQFYPMSSKKYSFIPCQASKLQPPVFLRVCVSSFTLGAVASGVLQTADMWEPTEASSHDAQWSGCSSACYFTLAKRLLKGSLVTRNRRYEVHQSMSQSLYCRRHIRRQYRNVSLTQGVSAHY